MNSVLDCGRWDGGHTMTEIVLTIDRLSIASARTSTPVLDNVSMSIARGTIVGVIGESGAGKTTLGLALLGALRTGMSRRDGRVTLSDTEILGPAARDPRILHGTRIAYVAQSAAAAFTPTQRLIEQVIETAVVRRVLDRDAAHRRAIELFALLGLPDPARFGERYPNQASGGQLQRAMVAMALCASPDIVVFDEPTAALDAATRDQV
ncbi:ATP-binding cassette domain-containing protein [Burkholderia ambifaria]|uniref:ATP-binding cassette domain-containing protein n=1 Tax=Burkholderia sp. SIMBA_019 TaxID=3085765 RepID=UPI00158E2D0E